MMLLRAHQPATARMARRGIRNVGIAMMSQNISNR
jgi:hypothetical protein